MILAIHQSQYLPWLPYFDKIDFADIFILLDNVQFQKNGLQNRNKVRYQDESKWISIPVKAPKRKKISEIEINGHFWKNKHLKLILQSYAKSSNLDYYKKEIEKIYLDEYKYLVDINYALINWIVKILNIKTKIILSSSLNIDGKKSDYIFNICKFFNAKYYYTGAGAKNYINEELFFNYGIKILYQKYNYPIYKQSYHNNFIKNLSALDLILNVTPDKLRDNFLSGRNSNL